VWGYRTGGVSKNHFPRKHDILLCYGKVPRKNKKTKHNPPRERIYYQSNFMGTCKQDKNGNWYADVYLRDVWDDTNVKPLINVSKERLGYPTQKPRSLLARIIRASTDKGDIVLDPFCGCGTTAYAAEELERQWIGIDISNFAVGVIKNSLVSSLSNSNIDLRKKIKESGIPRTPEAAKKLAEKDRHEFEKWVCGQIGARGLYKNPGAKGADGGIDGVIEFYAEKSVISYAIVQVKSGTVKPNDVKALYADVSDEPEAKAGVFVCFAEHKQTFINNRSHRTFKDEIAGNEWPVIQLVTIEELLKGKQPHLPNIVRKKGSPIKTQTELDM